MKRTAPKPNPPDLHLEYLAAMLHELRPMAVQASVFLGHLVGMAHQEALDLLEAKRSAA